MPNYAGWGFFKFNPWRAQFDRLIQWHKQAGLIDEWKWRTWVKKKALARNSSLHYEETAFIAPLSMDDMQSAFVVHGFMLAIALITLMAELVRRQVCNRSD